MRHSLSPRYRLSQKGAYDRAIEDFDQAIRLDPQSAIAYLGRARAYREKADYDRAV
jgi:tetratricopeptide (TPR) repeat protein